MAPPTDEALVQALSKVTDAYQSMYDELKKEFGALPRNDRKVIRLRCHAYEAFVQALEEFYEEHFLTMRDAKQNAVFGIRVADWIEFARAVGVNNNRVRCLRIEMNIVLFVGVQQAVR